MIVTTPLPPRARITTATATLTTAIETTITITFKTPLHQIHHQIHLKIYPLNQPTGFWKKGTILIVGDSMIAGLREFNLSRSRKVKARSLRDTKTENLMFHLISFLNKNPDNVIIHTETNNGPHSNENTIYEEIKLIKELIKAHHPDCRNTFFSSPTLRSDNKKLPTH